MSEAPGHVKHLSDLQALQAQFSGSYWNACEASGAPSLLLQVSRTLGAPPDLFHHHHHHPLLGWRPSRSRARSLSLSLSLSLATRSRPPRPASPGLTNGVQIPSAARPEGQDILWSIQRPTFPVFAVVGFSPHGEAQLSRAERTRSGPNKGGPKDYWPP